MRRLLLLLFVLAVVVVLYHTVRNRGDREIAARPPLVSEPLALLIVEAQAHLPAPLRITGRGEKTVLTVPGVIELTNREREARGLRPLEEHALLEQAAAAKLADMFDREYFAHVSPLGVSPSDVVHQAGYLFLSSGENLAMGNFGDDARLVQGWMESPGHRANILKHGFWEIGVAVGEGMFEGAEIWLAVQVFGTPEARCVRPDEELELEVEELSAVIFELQVRLSELELQLPARASAETAPQLLEEHREMVRETNEEMLSLRDLTDEYNAQVEEYNECVRSFIE